MPDRKKKKKKVECLPLAAPNHLDKHLSILLAEVMGDKYHLLSQHFYATIEAHLYNFCQVYEPFVITLVLFQGLIFTFL